MTDRFVLDDVADAVAAEGVTAVYGVLGDGNLHLGLALERAGVAWVSTRQSRRRSRWPTAPPGVPARSPSPR